MKLIPVLLVLAGALFVYSGIKDKDPRNVVFEGLGIKQRVRDPAGIGETDLGVGTFAPHIAGSSDTSTPGQKVTSV